MVDIERTRRLVELARPCSVTFHRAFDVTADLLQALDDLMTLGIDRLLTSGQAQTAIDGLRLITRLVQRAVGRIIIMPGGGISAQNIHQIIVQSGVTEIHAGSAVSIEPIDSASGMFAALRRRVDARKVRELMQRL
jgi:copper homeostasis protein